MKDEENYPSQTILDTIKFCYKHACNFIKERIAVMKYAAY